MAERKPQLSDELRYRLLKELENNPSLSQRELADTLGISVGKVNYCVRALVQKGWVKARNFKNSNNKLAYTYYLTPRGIDLKAQLAFEFLQIKLREVEMLREELAEIQRHARERHQSPLEAAPAE
jgi:EPS-associated MarR family transcriptional regulator